MVQFKQQINHLSGEAEWAELSEEYDFAQEIARAKFADMLHDNDRNHKYWQGLSAAIQKTHREGKLAHVLDIGTGTGLLSLMAVKSGADTIHACEAFNPMAHCAMKIIKENGYDNKIKLIPKRSTEIKVGPDGDMKHKANILVTEVFDTELIGEGAIETFAHALSELLEKDCIVVPHSATIYAQIVECPYLQRWNKIMDVANDDGDVLIRTPPEVKNCSGSAAVHDIQLSQVKRHNFKEITKPIEVLHFDWSGKTPIEYKRSLSIKVNAVASGSAQMVFMWWELTMDTDNEILLSCAPWWSHPNTNFSSPHPEDTIPWRDHWMQAIYYFSKEKFVNQGDALNLSVSHDEYSLWFGLQTSNESIENVSERPICNCGIHMTYSRSQVGYLNDSKRQKKTLQALQKHINKDTVALCLNGASLMGLAIPKMGGKKIIYIEPGLIAKRVLQKYIDFNKISNQVDIFPDVESVFQKYKYDEISIVLGDPSFNTAILPWDNFRIAYFANCLYKNKASFKMIPSKCTLWCMSVEFLDLHKIKSPINICEDINMRIFDDLIKSSEKRSDDEIEAQPLWEYPCYCRCSPMKILEVNFENAKSGNIINSGSTEIDNNATYNAFTFWISWDLLRDESITVNSGPMIPPVLNGRVSWDPFTRQAVKLLDSQYTQAVGSKFTYNVQYNFDSGNMNINVAIE